jgi:hypothetical protein
VAERVFDFDAIGGRAVVEEDLHSVSDRTFVRVEVIDRVVCAFDDFHL